MSHHQQQLSPPDAATKRAMNNQQKLALFIPIAAIAAAMLLGLLLAGGGDKTGTPIGLSSDLIQTGLHKASTECGAGELADDDHTLVVDMAGEDYNSGDDTYGMVTCLLDDLDTPQSVIAQMESTRALDGMQTATWEGYKASWTYHPDDGLDLIITQVD